MYVYAMLKYHMYCPIKELELAVIIPPLCIDCTATQYCCIVTTLYHRRRVISSNTFITLVKANMRI